jgi:hypothetical protein
MKPDQLEKARGKSLVAHFKKVAAHHEKMADHHEKCMKAHEAASAHHESMMGKAEDPMHGHHKAKAAFHKSMAGNHEKAMKTHTATAEHHQAMATAHDDTADDDTKKAAFAKLEIEIPTGDTQVTDVNKTANVSTAAAVAAAVAATSTDNAAATNAAATTTTAADSIAVGTDFADFYSKALEKGLKGAIEGELERLMKSPEFGAVVQEKLAKMMLEKLGAAEPAKTFAVVRTPDAMTTQKTIATTGATPTVPSAAKVDAQFLDLVSMGN